MGSFRPRCSISYVPPTDLEIDEFITQCPFDDDLDVDVTNILLGYGDQSEVELDKNEFLLFQEGVSNWSGVNAWLAGDDWPIVYGNSVIFSSDFRFLRQVRYNKTQLHIPETKIEIGRLSPSFKIIERLVQGGMKIDALDWREFEELIAELLDKDGYSVKLGPGRDDGGVDIVATKDLGQVGLFKSYGKQRNYDKEKRSAFQLFESLQIHGRNRGQARVLS